MYKININSNTLFLIGSEELMDYKKKDFGLIAPYSGKTKMLLSYIDMLEKTNRINTLAIHYPNLKELKDDFESLMKVIRASGGVVVDEKDKVLMIFRRGSWDLPKGKIDEGEKKKTAAIREVIEETGVNNPIIIKKLKKTRHVYRLKNGTRALKLTYWYLMSAQNQKLTPQTSEDIVEAKWANPQSMLTKNLPMYDNIFDVLSESGHLKTSEV